MFGRRNEVRYSPVFVCEFVCNNCGHSWNLDFERGIEIVQGEIGSFERVGKKDTEIICPNCESIRSIVTARYPLVETRKNIPQQQFVPQQNFNYQEQIVDEQEEEIIPPMRNEPERENIKRIMTKRKVK